VSWEALSSTQYVSSVTLVKIIMGRLHVVTGNKQTTQDRPVDRLDQVVLYNSIYYIGLLG